MPSVELREVTRANYMDALRLEVAPGQESYVASNAKSLAQYAFEPGLTPLLAYDGETAVGFVLVELAGEDGRAWIWRVMVDARYQGQGYGRALMMALIARLRDLHGLAEVSISYVPANAAAARLYAGLGFVETGEVIDGETVARLAIPPRP